MEAPPLELQLREGLWPFEAAAFSCLPVPSFLLPRGKPQPVLVLPGFTGGDISTLPLRQTLRRHGHWVHSWRLGNNIGPTRRAVDGMRARLQELSERHDTPIALVGWSLGGVFARALARERPDCVSQVITMGSPFRARDRDRSSVQLLWDRVRPLHERDFVSNVSEESRPPLLTPSSSIYTKTDGIVRWELCVDDVARDSNGRRCENIEVYGTHTGLGFNSSAAYAILDRLARPVSDWQPFRPPSLIDWWYPPLSDCARENQVPLRTVA